MKFNNITDKIEEVGFIDKNKLLKYVSEEDIFELVFGFKPVEFEYTTSPFREDNNAGCWFEIKVESNKLMFIDFADDIKSRDCFSAVQEYFKLSNFYKTVEFIKSKLIDGKNIEHTIRHVKPKKFIEKSSKKVKIFINTRDFNIKDKQYWSKYGISKQNLIDDKVFAVKKFKMVNTRKGNFLVRPYDICYAYTDFKSNRIKLYRPFKKGKERFLTNCKLNDIGGLKYLPKTGKQLVISKSYKDYRVLKNQGLNVVWFQNEGMFPSKEILLDLTNRFSNIIVFFDNDKAGIKASIKLTELLNSHKKDISQAVYIPIKFIEESITDPSDLVHKYNEEKLKSFLMYKKVLTEV